MLLKVDEGLPTNSGYVCGGRGQAACALHHSITNPLNARAHTCEIAAASVQRHACAQICWQPVLQIHENRQRHLHY